MSARWTTTELDKLRELTALKVPNAQIGQRLGRTLAAVALAKNRARIIQPHVQTCGYCGVELVHPSGRKREWCSNAHKRFGLIDQKLIARGLPPMPHRLPKQTIVLPDHDETPVGDLIAAFQR